MTAVFRGLAIAFARDRAALAMSFALPVAFFLVFAAIFGATSGGDLTLELAVADEVGSDASRRLLAALRRETALRFVGEPTLGAEDARRLVRSGRADVGLVVRRDAQPLGDLGGLGRAPLLLYVDPARGVAARVLAGLVQKAYFTALPELALGSVARLIEEQFVELSAEQRQQLAEGLAELRKEALEAEAQGRTPASALDDLLEREDVVAHSRGRDLVAYYAGAVAVLFLFFSAAHTSLGLFDERDSGMLDRLLCGPSGLRSLLAGRFLFQIVEGGVQVGVIFAVAWLLHGVDLPARLAGFVLVTLAAAAAAGGLTLALAAACGTRRQAQALGNIAILIVSAVGGSMVPRFLMPPLVRQAGWLTPHAWALGGYEALFWRGEGLASTLVPCAVLLGFGLLGFGLALRLARRWETV